MKKKNKRKITEKVSYDNINNADSMWGRMSSGRKAGKAGKEIQQIMDIEDDGPDRRHHATEPMKMMDLVFQDWEGDQADDKEPGEDETDEDEYGMEVDDVDEDKDE